MADDVTSRNRRRLLPPQVQRDPMTPRRDLHRFVMDVDAPDVEGLIPWKATNELANGDLATDRRAGHDEAVSREDERAVHRKPEVTARARLVRGLKCLEDLAAQALEALPRAERKRNDRRVFQ